MPEHALNGNCWDISHDCTTCGLGTTCDVCHEHDEPRGECSECTACAVCVSDETEQEGE